MYIKVNRRNRPDCVVMLCQDRATKKWYYVNLTTEHVCSCRFDTIDDAFADMKKRADVESFSVINNPFAPCLTENAMSPLISRISNFVDMFRENEEMEKIRKNNVLTKIYRTMINEQIKQLVNVLQAYVNGKTIQYYDVDYSFKIEHPGERNFNNKWVDVDEDHIFRLDLYEYRIKPEPKYRPFKDADECWQEMLKHQPFGWVKEKGDKPSHELLACVSENDEAPISFAVYGSVGMGIIDRPSIEFNEMFNAFTFADSAPFGVKEEI